MERNKKNKLTFCFNSLLFILAITALVLLRIYITEPPEPLEYPTVDQIAQFMESLDGDYYFDMDLLLSRTSFYTAVKNRPMVVVEPANEEDVIKIMYFVQRYPTWPFSIKSGGHSGGEYCLNNNGLVMDISKSFTDISWGDLDRSTLVVKGGTTFGKIYQFLNGTGKGIVGGTCTTVGISGYLLGGGISRFSKLHGLAIDTIIEINLILANGTKTVASDQSNQDLFWALRGGGGGNFGVVTSVKIRTFDISTISLVTACWNDISYIPLILGNWAPDWRDLQAESVFRLWIDRSYTAIRFCIDMESFNTTTQQVLDYMLPLIPEYDTLSLTQWDKQTPVFNYPPYLNDYYILKSMVVATDAFNPEMNEILKNTLTILKNVPRVMLFYENFGKRINQVAKSDTAFPHRNNSGILELKLFYPRQFDSVLGSAIKSEANELWRQLSPWGKGGYINYMDPAVQNWPENYYGDNYDRLKSIKSEVDPTNFFRFDRSIGSK